MDKSVLSALKDEAFGIRCSTIREIASFGSGHIGGSMSIVELLTYLYYREMNIDPSNPGMNDRDRLVVSKGHAGPAVYATLARKGFFPEEWLSTLNQGGTRLPSHCDMTKTPGIDFTGGSLGQGISAAVGIALGQRIKKQNSRTFCIIGDGESQEGEVWEAAESAGAWKLDNLFVFLDLNGQQLDGYTKDIIPQLHVPEKWSAFMWDVHVINGQDFEEIESAINDAKLIQGMPHMIVMHTIKSYGYIPGEGKKANHSMTITKEDAEAAIEALAKREGRV